MTKNPVILRKTCRAPNPGIRDVYYYSHPLKESRGAGGVAVVLQVTPGCSRMLTLVAPF